MNYEIIRTQPVKGAVVALLKYKGLTNPCTKGVSKLTSLYYVTYALNIDSLRDSLDKMCNNKNWFGRDEETGKITENLQNLKNAQKRFDELVRAFQNSNVKNGVVTPNKPLDAIKQPAIMDKPENLYGPNHENLIPAIREATKTGKVNTDGFSASDAKLLNGIAKLKQDSDFLKLL